MERIIEKAAGMIEALPYIQQFRNETIVVKFGGSIMDDQDACRAILQDVAFMEVVGLRPVVVHGGGKAISRKMEEGDLKPHFHHGLRVTDAACMAVVEEALNYIVNPAMVAMVAGFNCRAVGMHGQDILTSVKHTAIDPETGEELDWGFVGEISRVDTGPIQAALDAQSVPVITPLARGEDGHLYNINADEAAAAIARALKARKLVFLSDVPGVLAHPGDVHSIITHIETGNVEEMIRDGVLSGGMIPKLRSAVKTIESGVRKVHIIDSSLRHSLLLELFTNRGVGTEIVPS
jgi:acetylglutamate kinase